MPSKSVKLFIAVDPAGILFAQLLSVFDFKKSETVFSERDDVSSAGLFQRDRFISLELFKRNQNLIHHRHTVVGKKTIGKRNKYIYIKTPLTVSDDAAAVGIERRQIFF